MYIYIYYDREQTLEADACYTMAKAKLNNYTPNTKLNNYGRACYTMAKTSRPAMRSLTGINGLF